MSAIRTDLRIQASLIADRSYLVSFPTNSRTVLLKMSGVSRFERWAAAGMMVKRAPGILSAISWASARRSGKVQFTDDDLGGTGDVFQECDGIRPFSHCHQVSRDAADLIAFDHCTYVSDEPRLRLLLRGSAILGS